MTRFLRRTSALLPLPLALALLFPACGGGAGRGSTGPGAGEGAPVIRWIDPPAGPGAMAPAISASADGVWLSWLEPTDPGAEGREREISLRAARFRGGGWEEPTRIVTATDLFANWADCPSVARAGDGSLYAHWLRRNGESTYAYEVRLARSTDEGRSWSPMGTLHHDGTETEHGFVSFVPEGDGVRAFWLDGRLMAGEGPMTLRTASVGEEAGADTVLDDRVCECCQTSAVITAEGPLVVYRDRSGSEVRDIFAVRREGRGWSEPAPVHRDGWEIPGCPVNGPAAAADGRQVAVAWITSEAGHSRVLASFSADAGLSFGEPVVVDNTDPLGRVDVALTGDGEAAVTWLDGNGGEAAIRVRRVSPRGGTGPPLEIGRSSRARASGFPRIAASGSDLFVAWTQDGTPSRLRVARVSLPGLPRIGATRPDSVAAAAAATRPWDRRPGSVVPEFSAATLDGKGRNLSEYVGEALLVNLWATWCRPCREEIPDLIQLHRRHGAEGLRVLGLSVDAVQAADEVRAFVQAREIPYEILHDTEGKAATLFGVEALPASFLFDRRGVLVWSRYGLVQTGDPALEEALSLALSAGPAPAGAPR